MSRFTILLSGDLVATATLRRQVAASRVIAADAGIRHAAALGVVPELWVGDFDSVPAALPESMAQVPRRTFPVEKDKTDGELAADIAMQQGATALLFAGAFGGSRGDHEFLHLALAWRLASAGQSIMLSSGTQEGIPLLPGTASFDYPDGTLFSILAFSDLAGLSVHGAKWPLRDVTVEFGSSLTLSNETCGHLTITLGSGRALLIVHPKV